jgi:hypothetical protein
MWTLFIYDLFIYLLTIKTGLHLEQQILSEVRE